jgi:uncharacterized integral membrane protein
MRVLLRFIGTVLLVAAVVVLAIFSIQNTHTVQATFAGHAFSAGLWWLVLGAAILGFLLAAILMMPGWISAGWRSRTLRRTTQAREQEIQALRSEQDRIRAEHERLLAEHRQVVAERDRLRAGTGATQPVGAAAAPPASPEQTPRAGTTTTVYSANETPATGQSTMGGPVAPQPQQPRRRQEERTPDGPAVPTT